jgi:hypothetical protein
MRMKAFPTLADNGHITTQDGMDLRDYFAAKAMAALILKWGTDVPNFEFGNFSDCEHELAIWSYGFAEAMMKVRENV